MKNSMSPIPGSDISLAVGEYVCGLLTPDERPPVHVLLSKDDYALEQALSWENELLALVDALPPAAPPAALRERLQRTLGIGPPPAFQPPPQPQLLRQPSAPPQNPEAGKFTRGVSPGSPATPKAKPAKPAALRAEPELRTPPMQGSGADRPSEHDIPAVQPAPINVSEDTETNLERAIDAGKPGAPSRREASTPAHTVPADTKRLVRKLWLWRLIGVAASAAALVGFMLPGEPPPPPVQVVKVAPTRAAILQAPGTSSTPGWTATLGPEGDLMMRPLVHTEVPTGSQTLLWTRSARIPQARLLGRIDPNQPVQVPAAQLGSISDDQLFEITLETDEDAAKGSPNGPILFIGQMTVFGSEAAAAPSEQARSIGSTSSGSSPSATSGTIR